MNVGIIGAQLDLGADRRGVDMGASAIRYAGLKERLLAVGHNVKDFGNIAAPVAEGEPSGHATLKYLAPIVRACSELADAVSVSVEQGWFPLVLGGDHAVSLGSVSGATRSMRLGMIWLDAHGDYNTAETSPSGNIHGMVLAALTGYGDERLVHFDSRQPKVIPNQVALIGVRELDPEERTVLHASGVHVFSMYDIDRVGLPAIVEQAIAKMDPGLDGIHLSLDLDVVDPKQAPGVGTPVLGGLSYRETHVAMELFAESGLVRSMDVVEVNPVLDSQNETARLAVQFALSALGKRIY